MLSAVSLQARPTRTPEAPSSPTAVIVVAAKGLGRELLPESLTMRAISAVDTYGDVPPQIVEVI